MKRAWKDKEETRITLALAKEYSPWRIAVMLSGDLGRTRRAVETRARDIMRRKRA